MSERQDLERLLASHLDATADPRPRRGQLDAVMRRVAASPQRPGWSGVLTADGRAALWHDDRGQLRLALLVAALLLLLLGLAAIGLVAGGRKDLAVRLPANPTPPAVAVLPGPSQGVPSPTPTGFVTPTAQPTQDPCGTDGRLAARGVTSGAAWGSAGTSGPVAAVSPGKIAVWASSPDGTSDVDLLDPATGAQTTFVPLGIVRGKDQQLAWSPDGSALAIGFSADCGGEMTLIRTADGIVRLDPGPGITTETASLEWSPDASRVAVIPIGSATPVGTHVWILPRDGSAKTDLEPPCDGCNTSWFRWSPDGRHLAGIYQRIDADPITSGVAIADVTTGTWTVFPEGSVGGLLVGWRDNDRLVADLSPDGTDRFIQYDMQTGSRTILPIASTAATGAVALLPDRRHVLEFANAGTGANTRDSVVVLDLETGSRRTAWSAPRGVALGGGILAPDGSQFVMDGGRWDAPLPTDSWVIRLDGSGATKLPGVDIDNGAWQPILP
jgi:hypothetical protein